MTLPKTCIVTCLNSKLYKEYGHKTLPTFPSNIHKFIWSEDTIDGLDTIQLDPLFYNRNKHRTVTSYKHDAVRFHWKVNAIYHTLPHTQWFGYDTMIWVDADTLFLKDIDTTWFYENTHTDNIMSYLGRKDYYYSECSLLYFNLRNKHTEQYIKEVWDYYATDNIYNLQEWHDSYIWDYVRQKQELEHNKKFRDLGDGIPKVPGGHISSHLYGEYFDHMKGNRKVAGSSPENKYNKQ